MDLDANTTIVRILPDPPESSSPQHEINSLYYEEPFNDSPSVSHRPRFTPLRDHTSPIYDSDNHIIHTNLVAAADGVNYVTAVYGVTNGNVDPANNAIIAILNDNNIISVLNDLTLTAQ